jgi:hypothetical protein
MFAHRRAVSLTAMNSATATTTIMMAMNSGVPLVERGTPPVFHVTCAPLPAAVTVHYDRRRTGDRTDPPGGGSARSGRWPDSAGGLGIGGK